MRKALLIYLHGKGEPGLSLALGYLKAYADADEEIRRTWAIEIHHALDDSDPRDVVQTIERSEADLVGFSCYSWNIQAVHRVVKGLDSRKRPLVVVGGVEVTPQPQDVLRKNRNLDFVVIGEGEMDQAPMLYIGEIVGNGLGDLKVDIAVDPLDGTTLCATGLPNAIATIAAAEEGGFLHAPDMYMDKIAVGPAARGAIDLRKSPRENVHNVADALGL